MERSDAAGSPAESAMRQRRFGLLMAVACALVAAQAYRHESRAIMAGATAGAVGVVMLAAFAPGLLARPLRGWLRLGEALHKVMNPVILAVIFFGVVFPTSLVLRLARRRPLLLERRAGTYWIDRTGPRSGASMKNLF